MSQSSNMSSWHHVLLRCVVFHRLPPPKGFHPRPCGLTQPLWRDVAPPAQPLAFLRTCAVCRWDDAIGREQSGVEFIGADWGHPATVFNHIPINLTDPMVFRAKIMFFFL